MPKITDEIFDEIVNYIINPPYHNITETAAAFGTTTKTVAVHLKRLSTIGDSKFDLAKAQEVNRVLEHLLSISRAKSGSKSHRDFTFTQEQALELRYKNVYLKISTRDLAAMYGCSHMTVYNAINSLSDSAKRVQDEEVRVMIAEQNEALGIYDEEKQRWKR